MTPVLFDCLWCALVRAPDFLDAIDLDAVADGIQCEMARDEIGRDELRPFAGTRHRNLMKILQVRTSILFLRLRLSTGSGAPGLRNNLWLESKALIRRRHRF